MCKLGKIVDDCWMTGYLHAFLQQEKVVLEIVNFPFIIQYARSFKDSFDVYFLVEYVKGIELFDVIRDIGRIEDDFNLTLMHSLLV